MMMMWISRSVDLGKSEEMFCFLHVFSITCHKSLPHKSVLGLLPIFSFVNSYTFVKTSNWWVLCLKIPKVFTTGTNRWDWHGTKHQQPTVEDGNLRWGDNGHLFKWSSIGKMWIPPNVLTRYKQNNLNPTNQSGVMSCSMISLDDVGGFFKAILGWWFSWFSALGDLMCERYDVQWQNED